MLSTGDMINLLSKTSDDECYQNHNDDEDFGKVLEGCKSESMSNNKIRCSDGKERVFSFEE